MRYLAVMSHVRAGAGGFLLVLLEVVVELGNLNRGGEPASWVADP